MYDWAGEERTGPPSEMRKSADPPSAITRQAILAPMVNYGYYPAPAMPDAANLQFRRLAKHDRLRGRNREEFPPVSSNTGEKSTPSTTKIISSQFIGDAVCTCSSCRGQCRRRTTMPLILVSVRRPSTCSTGGCDRNVVSDQNPRRTLRLRNLDSDSLVRCGLSSTARKAAIPRATVRCA